MENREIKDIVTSEYAKGNIVINTLDGLRTIKVSEFIEQPASGILYDLNRDEVTILTFVKDEKWINDFALSKVVHELKKKIDWLEKNAYSSNR